ncbi:hypothetical protein DFH27DRAFT_274889 [Peziza echinospora]|nr:hypothetical protein DFH27DRAFT_274889 [Peziza echinospora]
MTLYGGFSLIPPFFGRRLYICFWDPFSSLTLYKFLISLLLFLFILAWVLYKRERERRRWVQHSGGGVSGWGGGAMMHERKSSEMGFSRLRCYITLHYPSRCTFALLLHVFILYFGMHAMWWIWLSIQRDVYLVFPPFFSLFPSSFFPFFILWVRTFPVLSSSLSLSRILKIL